MLKYMFLKHQFATIRRAFASVGKFFAAGILCWFSGYSLVAAV